MKRTSSFIVIIAILVIVVFLGKMLKVSDTSKGGDGEGMFEKNSKCISLYKDGELVCNIKAEERMNLINLLKENNWNVKKHEKRDDSYNIVLDFNNDICKLYIREEDKTCYLQVKEDQYELSKEVHTFILNLLENQDSKND